MTLKGQGRDPNMFGPIISQTAGDTRYVIISRDHKRQSRQDRTILKSVRDSIGQTLCSLNIILFCFHNGNGADDPSQV